jgi:hypothetical protein
MKKGGKVPSTRGKVQGTREGREDLAGVAAVWYL